MEWREKRKHGGKRQVLLFGMGDNGKWHNLSEYNGIQWNSTIDTCEMKKRIEFSLYVQWKDRSGWRWRELEDREVDDGESGSQKKIDSRPMCISCFLIQL